MILSNTAVREALESGQIEISPVPSPGQFDTSSLDLRLGELFKRYREDLVGQPGVDTVVDPDLFDYRNMSNAYMEVIQSSEDNGSIVIKPDEFVLAVTKERIHLPEKSRIAARIEGRSTLARIGLSVHLTAPTIQLGFRGHLVLEIKNNAKLGIRLTPGMEICQLIFERVDEQASGGIGTSFQGQESP